MGGVCAGGIECGLYRVVLCCASPLYLDFVGLIRIMVSVEM